MLLSDRPIVCATEDQLGFQPFCATLAKGLREMAPAEGLVVALHAPWGSGKTSALNLLQRHLEVLDIAQRTNQAVEEVAASAAARPDGPTPEECKRAIEWADLRSKHEKHLQTVVVRFNPWFFSGQENLFKAFFGVFGTELSTTCDTQVAAAVAAVLKRAEAAGSVLGTVLGTMAAGPGGAATGGTIGGFFGKLVGDKFDEKESLDASLRQLRTALQQSGRRFLIIIDDIDRLLPEELRQMLTLIKSVGNLPNITYLLAFARAEVADLIKRAGVANADYMEKIVQVSFELPRVDRYSLRNMLFNRLDTIRKGKELEDTSRWGTAFFEHIDPYLKTPRDVTRLCNSLQVIWPSVEDEVDWTDLVMLEILRLHEPTVYDLVLDKLDRLTGEKSSLSDDKKWAEDLVPTAVNSADFRTAKEALMTLFPRLAEVWEPNTGSWRKDHHALRNRRLQCAEYARNYFSLAPAPDQFTTGQINGLFRAENSLEAFNALFDQAKTRKTRQGLTMVSRLLQQIREQITRKNPMPQALIRAVLAKSDEIVRIRDSERMLFEVNNALRLSWVMVEALRAVPESDRATVFLSWFNGLDGAYVLAEFISSMTSKARTSSDSIFPDVDHEVLREKALLTMRSLSAEPDFIRKPQGAMVLFTWGHLAGFDEVASWVKGRLKDDRAVLDLAAIMPSEVYSSPGGLWHRIDRKGWSLIVDVDAFSERLRRMAKKKGLADGDLAIIKAYEEALAKGTDERY